MFTRQPKIQYLHFKQYADNKISSEKELTPRAAKRHETQKMIDTVKTAMAFISAPCPAVQHREQGKTTEYLGQKPEERGEQETGRWLEAKGKIREPG